MRTYFFFGLIFAASCSDATAIPSIDAASSADAKVAVIDAASQADATLVDWSGPPAIFRTPDPANVCAQTPTMPCTPGDMGWVQSEYGSTFERADEERVAGAGRAYRLLAMVERVGPSNIDVLVLDQTGKRLAGVPVAFYYSSAPDASRPDEWYPNRVIAITGANGKAGFAMGGGSYLDTCGSGGPHAIWISEADTDDSTVPSDLADRLGMLGLTEHRHLELVFQRLAPDQEATSMSLCPIPD
jgi:hypothetical protein